MMTMQIFGFTVIALVSLHALVAVRGEEAQQLPSASDLAGNTQQKWGFPDPDALLKQAKKAAGSAMDSAADAAKEAKNKAVQATVKQMGLCEKIDGSILKNKEALAKDAAKALAEMPDDPNLDPKACKGGIVLTATAKVEETTPSIKGNKVAKDVLKAVVDPTASDLCDKQIKPVLKSAAKNKASKPKEYAAEVEKGMLGSLDASLEKNLKPFCPDLFKEEKWLDLGAVMRGEASTGTSFTFLGGFVMLFALSGLLIREAVRRGRLGPQTALTLDYHDPEELLDESEEDAHALD